MMSNERVDTVDLAKIISPRFYGTFGDLLQMKHTHYYFKGGRGSTKSSMISVAIIVMLTQDQNANAVVLRRVADTLRDSVVAQLEWAINQLHLAHEFKVTRQPLQITRTTTGQKIIFRGADDPEKIKSVKFSKGYAKIIWFEEFSEFKNVEAVRNIRQSLGRGGDQVFIYSFNPPKSVRNWVNSYLDSEMMRSDVLVHSSTYRTVPKEWLGDVFLAEANALKETNHAVYQHEYLGEVVGTGAEVFGNIVTMKLADEQVATFDKIYRGLDFGFAGDPLAYVEWYYDSARKRLFALNEVYGTGMSNQNAVDAINKVNKMNDLIVADSAEPRTIAEFRAKGLKVRPARKGPGSVDHGIKWLQDLNEIIIDPRRTPNIHREFSSYELETDKMGNLRGDYPDKDNHSIDSTRYAVEQLLKPRTKIGW